MSYSIHSEGKLASFTFINTSSSIDIYIDGILTITDLGAYTWTRSIYLAPGIRNILICAANTPITLTNQQITISSNEDISLIFFESFHSYELHVIDTVQNTDWNESSLTFINLLKETNIDVKVINGDMIVKNLRPSCSSDTLTISPLHMDCIVYAGKQLTRLHNLYFENRCNYYIIIFEPLDVIIYKKI